MPLYIVYATKQDLSSFSGIPEAELPVTIESQLAKASELIKQSTMNNLDVTNIDHLECAKLATCAQVEFWSESGEIDLPAGLKRFKIGDLDMDFGDSNAQINSNMLCARARAYLNDQSLLYRGVKLKRSEVQKV